MYRECDSTHVHDDKCICGKVLVENSKECDFETTAPEDSDSPSVVDCWDFEDQTSCESQTGRCHWSVDSGKGWCEDKGAQLI
jgi:hypothetical protein